MHTSLVIQHLGGLRQIGKVVQRNIRRICVRDRNYLKRWSIAGWFFTYSRGWPRDAESSRYLDHVTIKNLSFAKKIRAASFMNSFNGNDNNNELICHTLTWLIYIYNSSVHEEFQKERREAGSWKESLVIILSMACSFFSDH